jgi:putative endonuclease
LAEPAPYFVYVLSSLRRKYLYVGMSNDVTRRVDQHNRGYEKTTKPFRPFTLVYTESYKTREEARKREKFLKSGLGKQYLWRKIGSK